MIINCVTLSTGYRVLILEDFFDDGLLEDILQLCERHANDSDWHNAEWTSLRKIYKGQHPTYQRLLGALASDDIVKPLEQQLGYGIKFQDASLWADYPGFGPLLPHVEKGGTGQAQLFLTRKEYPTNGTSIMNLDKQLLFTLPYRNNFGWYFDNCTKIMHSREFDVPSDIVRYSLIFWYS
jgi:hypothetical protein